ncbi:MAG: metallophosphoesterase [Mycobacteriales bacterium]
MIIAHVSDTHLDGTARSEERTGRVMAYLDALPGTIDAVLVTGDIADHGLPAEYEQVRKLFDIRHPVLLTPGNHDRREAYREVLLGEEPSGTPINRVREVAGAVFALCDSTIPGEDGGLLADETLDWLDGVLADAADGAPVFVCFHHPPVTLSLPLVDGIRQRGEDRLAALTARYPRVAAFLCGHAHTAAASTFAGRPLLVAPGVISTVLLPWEADAGPHQLDLDVPPSIAFHILDDGGRLTTHYRVIHSGR